MVKVRLHGEPAEMAKLIELMCNDFPAIRVLSVSERYKDRGASVYERCYIDIVINPKPPEQAEQAEDFDDWLEKHPGAVVQGHSYDGQAESKQLSNGGNAEKINKNRSRGQPWQGSN